MRAVSGTLLVTDGEHVVPILALLNLAARPLGWSVSLRSTTGEDLDPEEAQAQARADRERFRLPAVRVAVIVGAADGDAAASPVDAERLLDHAHAAARRLDAARSQREAVLPGIPSASGLLRGVELNAIRSLDASES